jgi:hypothetical protein
LTAIDTWIDQQLQIPVDQNLQSSFLESGFSRWFNLDILQDVELEHEAQPSSDAIFLSILIGQAGNELAKSLSSNWDFTNDPAPYTLLKEFLIDPARAGPHFFNDEKFASLTENILRFIIKR